LAEGGGRELIGREDGEVLECGLLIYREWENKWKEVARIARHVCRSCRVVVRGFEMYISAAVVGMRVENGLFREKIS
jgi:hypothetical protein